MREWLEPPDVISIHALHEESDTLETGFIILRILISIHALHEESDIHRLHRLYLLGYFNPRSP